MVPSLHRPLDIILESRRADYFGEGAGRLVAAVGEDVESERDVMRARAVVSHLYLACRRRAPRAARRDVAEIDGASPHRGVKIVSREMCVNVFSAGQAVVDERYVEIDHFTGFDYAVAVAAECIVHFSVADRKARSLGLGRRHDGVKLHARIRSARVSVAVVHDFDIPHRRKPRPVQVDVRSAAARSDECPRPVAVVARIYRVSFG